MKYGLLAKKLACVPRCHGQDEKGQGRREIYSISELRDSIEAKPCECREIFIVETKSIIYIYISDNCVNCQHYLDVLDAEKIVGSL